MILIYPAIAIGMATSMLPWLMFIPFVKEEEPKKYEPKKKIKICKTKKTHKIDNVIRLVK